MVTGSVMVVDTDYSLAVSPDWMWQSISEVHGQGFLLSTGQLKRQVIDGIKRPLWADQRSLVGVRLLPVSGSCPMVAV